MHTVEILWEINNKGLLTNIKNINKLTSPLILFTFEGVKPRILLNVTVVGKEELEHVDKNVVIFPNNPKEEREKRIKEQEEKLLNMDSKISKSGW